ncbi:metal-dependent protease of the PAD1/JAB1 superfamily [Candidatus Scalindua japonica]|uniref:Metal-dependent protease of the PAD1/JAB1 superfamily n=2 Tax=Candidatus Scalindua japonica TaxID=1284222 RepID=A0A286U1S3_9BACT|nr:metal-dependent protease of the PAD1/JAB1 superfamily [Candidatus Scalindua japonica]
MLKEAKTAYPHECCGLLVGTIRDSEKTVHEVYPVENKNKVRAADRYEIDPIEFDRIDREATKKGWNITGIYHSHPDHPAEPSAFDKECACVWTEYSYIIISVKDGVDDELRCWRFDSVKQDIEEVEVKINRRDFIIGMSFIAFSFVVYFSLFLIPLFPLSKKSMVGAATIGYLFNWCLTGIGVFFAGKEGYALLMEKFLKGFFRKMIGKKEK